MYVSFFSRLSLQKALRSLVLAGVGLAILTGCSVFGDNDNAQTDGPIWAEIRGETLQVRNRGVQEVWVLALTPSTAISSFWVPSVDEPGIMPGQTERISLADRFISDTDTEMIVFWWTAVQKNGERVPSEVGSFRVPIPGR